MSILDKIIARKKEEVEQSKQLRPVDELEKMASFSRKALSLKLRLLDSSTTGIVAEFKRKSPSKGVINDRVGRSKVVKAYEKAAAGISVLTDTDFFGGSLNDLEETRAEVTIPILRKDFMIDPYQVVEAKAYGADVILLIAACLSPAEVSGLALKAHELGLEVLLEIHNESELNRIGPDIDLVGINNRNLKTFQVDLEQSVKLASLLPPHLPAIAESGIADLETLLMLRSKGFKGFLIGEYFMKEQDPAIAFADFVKSLKTANEN